MASAATALIAAAYPSAVTPAAVTAAASAVVAPAAVPTLQSATANASQLLASLGYQILATDGATAPLQADPSQSRTLRPHPTTRLRR